MFLLHLMTGIHYLKNLLKSLSSGEVTFEKSKMHTFLTGTVCGGCCSQSASRKRKRQFSRFLPHDRFFVWNNLQGPGAGVNRSNKTHKHFAARLESWYTEIVDSYWRFCVCEYKKLLWKISLWVLLFCTLSTLTLSFSYMKRRHTQLNKGAWVIFVHPNRIKLLLVAKNLNMFDVRIMVQLQTFRCSPKSNFCHNESSGP